MGFSAGANNLSGADDVALSSPANEQVLTYDSAAAKWKNAASAGGGGSSTSVQYVYFNADTSTWPSRPTGVTTVTWVGGDGSNQPSDPAVGKDIWIHDSEVV